MSVYDWETGWENSAARPAPGTRLVEIAAIEEPGAKCLDYAEGEARFSLLVARQDGEVRAYENLCPHIRAPLETYDGEVRIVEKKYIMCAVHSACFRILDGSCLTGPALGQSLKAFPIEVDDGWAVAA
ncbi:MAG: Rieske (2Fe-2S) protein [Hyphomonadaceae bacterium]